MIYESTIEIERPMNEVFDVATCQRRCVVWVSGIISNSRMDSDEPTHVGSTFTTDYRVLGQTYHLKRVITKLKRPHTFAFKIIEGLELSVLYTFTPTEHGTRFRMAFELEELPASLGLVLNNRLTKKVAHHIMQKMLKDLKVLMEDNVDLWALTPA